MRNSILIQASKTTFFASLVNNNTKTLVLKLSAITPISSVASSAEMAHLVNDALIIIKTIVLLSQNTLSIVLQISESILLLKFEKTIQKSFAASLLPNIRPL